MRLRQILGLHILSGLWVVAPAMAGIEGAPLVSPEKSGLVASGQAKQIAVPAQPIETALNEFARQSGIHVVIDTRVAGDIVSTAVKGELKTEEALAQLLKSTGLTYRVLDAQTIAVERLGTRRSSREAHNDRPLQLAQAQDSTKTVENPNTGTAKGASSQEGSSSRSSSEIQEIIVTAQKREERLQDVPISITALSGDALQRIGADEFRDYIGQVPGAFFSEGGAQGRGRINMRGIQTTYGLFDEAQSPTAIYIDDLPSLATANPWVSTDLRLFDIERIEVLRGPQGTLFGAGALGGALRILTNKPNLQEFDASMEAGMESTRGGDESWSVSSMVNIPVVQDKFAMRVVGYYRDEGGWIDNTFRNEKNANGSDSKGGRVLLGFQPTEDLSLRFTVTHQDDSYDDKPQVDFTGPTYVNGAWTPSFTNVTLTSYNLSAEYDFGPALLTSATSYADSDVNLGQGLGHPFHFIFPPGWLTSPDATFGESNRFTAETFAQELRLTSQTDGRFQWVLGGFYMDQDLGQDQHWYSSTVWTVTGSTTLGQWSVPTTTEQKALFGEVNYDLTSTLTAVVGARFFDQSFRRYNAYSFGILASPGTVYPTPVREVAETGVTPKFALRYKPSDAIMAYVQAARGFRLGQSNYSGGLTDAGNGFVFPLGSKSDELWNYEIGVKSLLLNRTLSLNAALYYIDWKKIQLQRGNPLPNAALGCCFYDNPGDAVSKGAEIEIEYVPTDYLTLGSSFSVADAKIDAIEPGVVGVSPGDRLPGTPEFWASNYIQLSGAGLIGQTNSYFRLSHRYTDGVINNIDNDSPFAAESDSYNVFDFRAGVYLGKYEVALHVNNIADSDAVTARFPGAGAIAQVTGGGSLYRLRPRTFGVTFRAQF